MARYMVQVHRHGTLKQSFCVPELHGKPSPQPFGILLPFNLRKAFARSEWVQTIMRDVIKTDLTSLDGSSLGTIYARKESK